MYIYCYPVVVSDNAVQTPVVTFRATGPPSYLRGGGGPIVFENETANIGNGYNNDTGVFTAPHRGLYLFTLQLCAGRLSNLYLMSTFSIRSNASLIGVAGISGSSSRFYLSRNSPSCALIVAHSVLNDREEIYAEVDDNILVSSDDENLNVFSGVLIAVA